MYSIFFICQNVQGQIKLLDVSSMHKVFLTNCQEHQLCVASLRVVLLTSIIDTGDTNISCIYIFFISDITFSQSADFREPKQNIRFNTLVNTFSTELYKP